MAILQIVMSRGQSSHLLDFCVCHVHYFACVCVCVEEREEGMGMVGGGDNQMEAGRMRAM